MDKFKDKNSKFAVVVTSLIIFLFVGSIAQFASDSSAMQSASASDKVEKKELKVELKNKLDEVFSKTQSWPESIQVEGDNYKIEYAFNDKLTKHIESLLKKYRSDYSTVVIIDNETGNIISAVGYEGRSKKFNSNLIMSSTHPAASLGKIITAADLVENTEVTKDSKFVYRGKSTTLYKYQINNQKKNKWDRTQSLEAAFAVSNNVIFGKAAIQESTIGSLSKTAHEFRFNQPYLNEFTFHKSVFPVEAKNDFNLAEISSGFNRQTLISPIHGALLAYVIANDGVYKTPKLISKIKDEKDNLVWENISEEERILTTRANDNMKDLMEATVRSGTARKSFRKLHSRYKDQLILGGKTGSLTGGIPFGKRDWFSFYAIPKHSTLGKGISISVMNVNVKKWYVKSTALAKEITQYYYKEIVPLPRSTKEGLATKASKGAAIYGAQKLMGSNIASVNNLNKKTIIRKKVNNKNKAQVRKIASSTNKKNKVNKKKSAAKKVVKKKVVAKKKVVKSRKVVATSSNKTKKKSTSTVYDPKKKNNTQKIGKNDERKSNSRI